MLRIAIWVATGFGLGRSPLAPGTVATLLGVPLAWALSPLAWPWQAAITALLCLAAVPVCSVAEEHFGSKDDHRIVADEYLTFPLCLLGIPWTAHPWMLVVAFLTHRAFDIFKPPPARQVQVLRGGLGIVVDDVISSLYALALNHALFLFMRSDLWPLPVP